MAQTIDTKLMSLNVQKYLDSSHNQMIDSVQRIASGQRVNSAVDDAAGLAIAERMNTQVRGINVGIRNAYDGISMSQFAEGGLAQMNDKLQRMRELALQSANGANSPADRENLNSEFTALNSEVTRIASTTKFNGQPVLAGDGSPVNYQVGPNTSSEDILAVEPADFESLSVNISTFEAALASVEEVDAMIAEVANSRAYFGAMQSRFESTINNLQIGAENQSAAQGRIMDADYAMESAIMARSRMMQHASTAMATQANVTPESVMRLLG